MSKDECSKCGRKLPVTGDIYYATSKLNYRTRFMNKKKDITIKLCSECDDELIAYLHSNDSYLMYCWVRDNCKGVVR